MSMLSVTQMNSLLDYSCDWARDIYGSSSSGFGSGSAAVSFGAKANADAIMTLINGSGDPDIYLTLGKYAQDLVNGTSWQQIVKKVMTAWINGLDRHVYQKSGITGVGSTDTFLKYYNIGAGGYWNGLQDGRWFRDAYYAAKNAYPSVYNCYFEVLQGTLNASTHLYSLGLGRFVTSGAGAGTFTKATLEGELVTDGAGFGKIDGTKFAGGVASVVVSGLSGSGVLTMTGNGYDPVTESIVTGKTWTKTISGNTTYDFDGGTGFTGNILLLEVTNVSIAAGITAGTFYIQARRPTGRPLI